MNNTNLSSPLKPALLFLLFTFQLLPITILPGVLTPSHAAATAEMMIPVGPTEYRTMDLGAGGARRKLAPFQLCLLCKCCAGATCASMPCCFGIDCQIPGKPFGVCGFVPKTCNCTSCPS